MDADTEKTAKPCRRWFRFRLRTLLIVVTVLSVPLGWVGWMLGEVRRERATKTWVEEKGGRVHILSGTTGDERSWWKKNTDKWFRERVWAVRLSNTQVSDLSPLAELKNLERLQFSNTQVSDLSPLAELKNLEWLSLSSQVSDLSPLAELKSLKRLYFSNTQVSDLSPLAELKNLERLYFSNTQVSDLSPLAELKNLEWLDLRDTQVNDLSPLADLKSLELLRLENTQVSDEQVQELRQALPHCLIIHSPRVVE